MARTGNGARNGVNGAVIDLLDESRDQSNAFVSTQHGEMRNGILSGLTAASLNRRPDELGYNSPNNTLVKSAQPATFAGRSAGMSLKKFFFDFRANFYENSNSRICC